MGKNGKLLKSLKNTKEDMHSAVTITDENVLTATKFKHDVVGKEFLKNKKIDININPKLKLLIE